MSRRCNVLLAALLLLAGCKQDMADQPRYEPLEPSAFFDDGAASRHPPVGAIARGQLFADRHFSTGRVDGELAETFPRALEEHFASPAAVLERGRERYNIFCAPCHDQTGHGRGMVVQRGFPPPPSFHIDRLRSAPVGHYFDVITHGFGRMYDYAAQVPPEDRWAIAAYIRVLQFSQHVPQEELSPGDVEKLNEAP
ncbi:MAG: cytochrome c [Planctomycetes bacterium]|nr:cytochrome c [Planctomycetota bacterium]